MLIDFSVTNFRSIKDKQTFSMQTIGKVKELPCNVIHKDKFDLLKSVIIYGHNASGKSNLLLAMDAMERITNENISRSNARIYSPFRLDISNKSKPTEFEVNFIAKDNIRYNYFISFNSEEIIAEKLYFYPNKVKRAKLFEREKGKAIKTGDLFKGSIKKVEEKLYSHHSLLSRVRFHKMDSLIAPFTFFSRHLASLSSFENINNDDAFTNRFIGRFIKYKNYINNINNLLKAADIGINKLEIRENKEDDFSFPPDFSEEDKKTIIEKNRYQTSILHNVYHEGNIVGEEKFDLKDESAGTKKLLPLGTAILDCLSDGDVVFVDELDKSLHPNLTRALINIFNNPKTNPNNAQLIFASHDVSLLCCDLFRRDQIWFVEKNMEGSSEYYSLADLKGVRKEIPYEKYYLRGAFGATPVINEYDFDFNFDQDE